MIIFDADSLMEGDLLVRMVNVMEPGTISASCRPRRWPQPDKLDRAVTAVCQPCVWAVVFAGLRFWQLDESGYWGITRLSAWPVHEYCALPHLSGKPPFGERS